MSVVSVTGEVAGVVLILVEVAPLMVEVPETVVAVLQSVVSVTGEVSVVVLILVTVVPVLVEVPGAVVAVLLILSWVDLPPVLLG